MLSDLSLARRLERAEGLANARFVEARARISPESGAEWIEVGGAYAMYDGPHSPCTQTFALGLFEETTAAHLDKLEAFFQERGASVFHEISPLADKALWPLLGRRGYRPVEFSSVMFLPLDGRQPVPPPWNASIHARLAGPQERELWARTAAEGWREATGFSDVLPDLMRVTAAREDALSFLAELDGQAVAAGAMIVVNGVALLAGASTIPQARHQGAQRALLESRLRHAAEAGCELAMMCAEPGSGSQRNAERQGFRIAYTRVKWGVG